MEYRLITILLIGIPILPRPHNCGRRRTSMLGTHGITPF